MRETLEHDGVQILGGMRKLLFGAAYTVISLIGLGGAHAQNGDAWFALLDAGNNQGSEQFMLFVTAPYATNIFVTMAGQATKVLPVQPNGAAAFNIPLQWVMSSSATVEPKAIHAWDAVGGFSAYLVCQNGSSTEGTAMIPSKGWGRDYVIASYNGFIGDSDVSNSPSEFVIVADADNTICTITPAADVRQESLRDASPNTIAHPKGIPFVEVLNRGDAVQYKTTHFLNDTDYDLTGTIVHSNNPIGILAGAQAANIPSAFQSPEYLCEMMPAVRLWAKSYYTAPFYPMNPGKEANTFLAVGTKANQTIQRYDLDSGERTHCILPYPYAVNWNHNISKPSRWSSDAPFMLVQYANSSTYPDGKDSLGAPSEVVVRPVEQYSKSIGFEMPFINADVTPNTSCVNIIAKIATDKSLKFNGKSIVSFPPLLIDSIYEVYRIVGHYSGYLVTCDSPVAVYNYCYGYKLGYALTSSPNLDYLGPDSSTNAVRESASAPTSLAKLLLSSDNKFARAIVPANWTQPLTLEIENVLGQCVATETVATTTIDFDLSSLSSGVYFYHLSCGNESAAGKLAIRK